MDQRCPCELHVIEPNATDDAKLPLAVEIRDAVPVRRQAVLLEPAATVEEECCDRIVLREGFECAVRGRQITAAVGGERAGKGGGIFPRRGRKDRDRLIAAKDPHAIDLPECRQIGTRGGDTIACQ